MLSIALDLCVVVYVCVYCVHCCLCPWIVHLLIALSDFFDVYLHVLLGFFLWSLQCLYSFLLFFLVSVTLTYTVEWVSEWLLFNANSVIFQLYHGENKLIFDWDDDDKVRFVLDKHAKLNLYISSSLKQQSVDKHVTPLDHIILI